MSLVAREDGGFECLAGVDDGGPAVAGDAVARGRVEVSTGAGNFYLCEGLVRGVLYSSRYSGVHFFRA